MIARLAVLALAVLATAGCASPAAPAEYEGVYPIVRLQHPHVTRTCPDVPAEHFDGDLTGIVAVYRCTAELLPPDAYGVVKLEHWVDRLEGSPDELLAAYAVPNKPPSSGACTLQVEDPLIIWVVRDDGTTPVYAPKDECGFPTAAARAAHEDADFERILVAKMVPAER